MNHFKLRTDPELDQSTFNDGIIREFICRQVEVSPLNDGDWEIILEVYDVYEI